MFNLLRTAFSKPTIANDPLMAETSRIVQEHEVASARLKAVLCKVPGDGPDCLCLKPTSKQ